MIASQIIFKIYYYYYIYNMTINKNLLFKIHFKLFITIIFYI